MPSWSFQNSKTLGQFFEQLYDGKASSAIAFWNTLENYYTVNTAVYADEKARIQSALTHFKLGT